MVSSALIESNNERICPKAFFNMSATFSSRSVSDKGSKIIVLGIGGKGKLNLQTAFPLFLHVLVCLCLCKFTSSVKSSSQLYMKRSYLQNWQYLHQNLYHTRVHFLSRIIHGYVENLFAGIQHDRKSRQLL